MTRKAILDKYPDSEFVFYEGLDKAIVGVTFNDDDVPITVYSQKKIIKALKMPIEEAWDYFEFNIAGLWLGSRTPLVVLDI